jgi:hypothetical protein
MAVENRLPANRIPQRTLAGGEKIIKAIRSKTIGILRIARQFLDKFCFLPIISINFIINIQVFLGIIHDFYVLLYEAGFVAAASSR